MTRLTIIVESLIVLLLISNNNFSFAQNAQSSSKNLTTNPADAPKEVDDSENVTSPDRPVPDQQELMLRQYKLILLLMIVGIIILFLAVLLITIIRIGRYRRRRLKLGQKGVPTEYVDSWSRYRLNDEEK